MDAGLVYTALKNRQVFLGLVYTTDGRLKDFKLRVLKDDKQYFPFYNAAPVVRKEVMQRHPEFATLFDPIIERLDDATMQALNARVDIEQQTPQKVAADFLREHRLLDDGQAGQEVASNGLLQRAFPSRLVPGRPAHPPALAAGTVAVGLAILVGVPLGVLMTRFTWLAGCCAGAATVMLTIPSIALFGLLMPVYSVFGQGLGPLPAITAVFLYSLLPIPQHHLALTGVEAGIREAGKGIGMTFWQRLRMVDIPSRCR